MPPLAAGPRRAAAALMAAAAAYVAAFATLDPPLGPAACALTLLPAAAGWLAGRAARGRDRLPEWLAPAPSADAALRKSETLLRLVWESAADGMRLENKIPTDGTFNDQTKVGARAVGTARTAPWGQEDTSSYETELSCRPKPWNVPKAPAPSSEIALG